MDQQLLLAINQGWASPGLDVFFAWISQGRAFSAPLLLGVLVFLGWRFGGAGAKFWLLAVILVGLGDQVGALLKFLTAQPRPCAELGDVVRRVDTLFRVNCSRYPNGWPSNHALNFFLFATFTGYVLRWRAWVLGFLAVATLVALSRVYLGVHYPSQILSGALIGGALGLAGGWLGMRYLSLVQTVSTRACSGGRDR